jgi:hypothetical protein
MRSGRALLVAVFLLSVLRPALARRPRRSRGAGSRAPGMGGPSWPWPRTAVPRGGTRRHAAGPFLDLAVYWNGIQAGGDTAPRGGPTCLPFPSQPPLPASVITGSG